MLLAQKKPGPRPKIINETTRLFSGLADLDFEPGYNDHVYFQYLSDNKNDISLLGAYHPEEIYSKYIIRVAGKGFTVVNHPSEVYGIPDAHDLRLLGSAKEDRVKRPAISSVKQGYRKLENYLVQPKWDASEIWPRTFSPEKPEKDAFQPIEDETALSKGAAKSYEACPICDIRHEKDQLYGFLRSDRRFILRCYRQKQYKPDHKGLTFGEASTLRDIIKPKDRPIQKIVDRVANAIAKPRPLVEFSEKTTTLIRSSPATWKTTTKSLSNESKAKLDELKASGFRICNYQNMQGELSINEWDIIIVQVESLFRIEFSVHPFVAILDEANAIMRQMSSGTNARESENAMRDVLRSARHVLAMDAFANKSTLAFLKIYPEAMRIGYDLLRQGKRVAFVSTGAVMARALVEKASKLFKPDNSPVRARAYYGDMDGKQRQKDFSDINVAWSELDCIAYTNTVEAGISFEITGHFDIVIAITNIATPVHVEALAQMLYRIRDCSRRIVSLFYQKNSNVLFRPSGHENIRAELTSARPNNLPTAIKGHREWNNNTISYKNP
ncbi:hypothetical protein C1645_831339 [Glomus cerebriforme]|uniref:Replication origin-binding protein domain-containing protein n=1 Tax=Glomus cerebriforme TaxID=658196 RepID=A0A397SKB5_9GLOM|nr:hypothetical protein C1645_831339 [Glomus cerebriforme]